MCLTSLPFPIRVSRQLGGAVTPVWISHGLCKTLPSAASAAPAKTEGAQVTVGGCLCATQHLLPSPWDRQGCAEVLGSLDMALGAVRQRIN